MPQNKCCSSGAVSPSVRGFTLIEIMIVLVVMGIVIAFAGPRVAGGLMGQGVRTAALQTAAMLRYARSKAVNTGCRYHVIFDGGGRRAIFLQGSREDMAGRSSANAFDAGSGPAEAETREYLLPDGVFFENVLIADIDSAGFGDDAVMMLTLYPSGMSPGARVTIADKRGRRFFISVDTIAGNVRVDEEQDDA